MGIATPVCAPVRNDHLSGEEIGDAISRAVAEICIIPPADGGGDWLMLLTEYAQQEACRRILPATFVLGYA